MSGSASSEALRWYEANAAEVAARHESLDPSKVHHWWLDQLPKTPVVILDVGAAIVRSTSEDLTGPTGVVRWTQLLIRLPDDGTGALPLLRHIILNDNKSSTYKRALLRTLCRIADGYLGMVKEADDEFVEIPHGLVALFWLRQFKPLLDLNLPQSPNNTGYQGLEFAKGSLVLLTVSPLDLRAAGRFTQLQASLLASSLRAAAANITKMPANFIRYPSGNQILSVQRSGRNRPGAALTLDREYLASFGWMRVPRYLWTALVRFNSWIEPAIIAEWVRYILGYAENQG